MTVLPPEAADPLWQPAQEFVAGEDTLVDVYDGRANATGACICDPRKTRTERTPTNNKNNAGRYRLTFAPSPKFLTGWFAETESVTDT
jgi:hypothetical protein